MSRLIHFSTSIPLLNPYLDLFRLLEVSSMEEPDRLAAIRKKVIWAYSWAVPSSEAIMEIARLSPLIELGAGTGYWSWLLRQTGANVLAFDRSLHAPPHWTEVQEGGPGVLDLHADRTLLLCWPPLKEPMAAECLDHFRGRSLVYIGEERGGNTASDAFHDLLERDYRLVNRIDLPNWPGTQDAVFIFDRLGIIP